MALGHTDRLKRWLDLARTGQVDARNETIEHACERLRMLTRNMLKGYPKVKRWSETDDVLQNAMIRLHRSLAEIKPETPRQFYGLAATQIRRELIDLARNHYGPQGIGAKHHTDGGEGAERQRDEHVEPESLDAWGQFHETVDELPDDQKEVVSLLWYEGLSQPETAEVLDISLATVKRRWQAARMTLFDRLKDLEFD
ncbi:MAG: sigma-70 family RNA polymerase sigma factor [Planctomycetes bacterium]|nr:sigma-70 family RNA polymerase sigma factor [Planctomycetota bacterium]